jgi:hypothetical protein
MCVYEGYIFRYCQGCVTFALWADNHAAPFDLAAKHDPLCRKEERTGGSQIILLGFMVKTCYLLVVAARSQRKAIVIICHLHE